MRWKIIILCALITVASAHIHNRDSGYISPPTENRTFYLEHHNYTTNDERRYTLFNSTKFLKTFNNIPFVNRSSYRNLSSAENYELMLVANNTYLGIRPVNITKTRNTNKEYSSEQSEEVKSNEIKRNKGDLKTESVEYVLAEGVSSSGNTSQTKTKNDLEANETMYITKIDTNANTNSAESEKTGAGEALYKRSNRSRGSSSESSCVTDTLETAGEPCSITQYRHIHTSYGPVTGYLWNDTSDIIGYFDIPYGQIKDPFQAPVAAQSWIDVHDAKNHTKLCPQLKNNEYVGELDCLTLSIFTPKDAENISVLFHIYDPFSNSNSADPTIYGPGNLVPRGIILVLPNYRVGPMGFLCMQNETAPGNAGLKDLSLALEWVKDNIQLFGGNPANIVVSGDGDAGAYAGYLGLSSRSRYYVNKVITESGSALSHLALDRDPIATAYILADKIKNKHSDGVIYNNTFEDVELETIIIAAKDMRFNPCLEKGVEPFMNNTPWKMLHNKEIDTTFMIGFASYAGAHEALNTPDIVLEELNGNFSQFLPNDLVFNDETEKRKFAQQLKEQYFGKNNINSTHVEELSLWYTDALYLGPGIRQARLLLQGGATVYLYEFAFIGSLNRELEALNKSVPGAVRSDIVGYLFRNEESTVAEDSPEKRIINLMVDLWVSFSDDGKPAADNIVWNELKKAEDSEEEWLLISSDPKSMKGVHLNRLRLWTSLYNEHFIERNSALCDHSQRCIASITLLIGWIANQLNYNL